MTIVLDPKKLKELSLKSYMENKQIIYEILDSYKHRILRNMEDAAVKGRSSCYCTFFKGELDHMSKKANNLPYIDCIAFIVEWFEEQGFEILKFSEDGKFCISWF